MKWPWTKQFEVLEKKFNDHGKYAVREISHNAGRIDDHEAGHIDSKAYHVLRKAFDDTLKTLEEKDLSYLKEIDELKQRLGQSELAHAAVFKKMSENFSESMARMIEVNGKAFAHISTLADQRNREIMAAMGIKSDEPEEFYITLNGQTEKVDSREMTYDQILDLFLYPFPERKEDELFSITYKDGGDEENPFGTISENDVLVVKPGTVISVSRLAEGG